MVVQSLALSHFRNYEKLDIRLDPGVNIFYGNNAQGKTNILEALYMCATTKSHRGSKDKEMIHFGEDESHIRMQLKKDGVSHKIDMHLKKGKAKGVAIDGLPIRRSGELFGLAHMICFSPEDLSMIKNGPAERRRFIDMELCQLDKVYLHDLSDYNKTVNQRNNLLKQLQVDHSLKDTLDVWDMQLVQFGRRVISRRREFIDKINNYLAPVHDKLTGGAEQIRMIYQPNVSEDVFEEKVFMNRDRDLFMKTTQTGPHRDDFTFEVGGIDIRRFGSQGQQRTAALSLKLAEIDMVREIIHDDPVLLLDDVLSELDSSRQNYLLDSISHIQTVMTCTGLDEFIENRLSIDRIFKVTEGHAHLSEIPKDGNEQEADQ